MKALRLNLPVTVSAAVTVLLLAASSVFAQSADSAALKNSAYAASPRAKELFPQLTRGSTKSADQGTLPSTPAYVTNNRSFAASPRALEQFPELSRPITALNKTTVNSTPETRNAAFAASPRALEQFPWLARGRAADGSPKTFEIAPLK